MKKPAQGEEKEVQWSLRGEARKEIKLLGLSAKTQKETQQELDQSKEAGIEAQFGVDGSIYQKCGSAEILIRFEKNRTRVILITLRKGPKNRKPQNGILDIPKEWVPKILKCFRVEKTRMNLEIFERRQRCARLAIQEVQ